MDKVAQLVKAAKEKRDENAGLKGVAAAGVAAHSAKKAPGRLLGYHTVYHGAGSRDAAKNIRKSGLKKSKGGTGVSRVDDHLKNMGTSDNVSRSKGKVYFTKKKIQGKHYTADLFNPMGDKKRLVKARISDDHYRNKSKKDSLTNKMIDQQAHSKMISEKSRKAQAAISSKSISPAQIEGSSKYKGRKQFATKKNMSKYLKSSGGRKRFLRGVADVAVAAGSGAYAAKKLAQEARNNK